MVAAGNSTLPMRPGKTKLFWTNHLPHWEIEAGSYFFTIRCAGSLPAKTLRELETHAERMRAAHAADEETVLLEEQRRYFLTMDKYLDQGLGFCPFRERRCAEYVLDTFDELSSRGWDVRHYVLMPNHVHLLLETRTGADPMKTVWRQWKGSTAREANRILGRSGPFWHRDWFDRWIRDPSMRYRTISYIQKNPVKAGLAAHWKDYPWVR